MELDQLTVEELKQGYRFDTVQNAYLCNLCQKVFAAGEVFPMDGRFYEAQRAVQQHVEKEHHGTFDALLTDGGKYNSLTDNQKELMSLIYAGLSDKEIAKKLGISPSTVRHQKFSFREKAKQAKLYLAICEQVMERKTAPEDSILPVPDSAKMVDDRFVITEKEQEKILETVFESLSPLKLRAFPPKEKKKIVILTKVATQFERGKRYTEKEVNAILMDIFDDYAVLRRYLVDYGFMERTRDCREYWLK